MNRRTLEVAPGIQIALATFFAETVDTHNMNISVLTTGAVLESSNGYTEAGEIYGSDLALLESFEIILDLTPEHLETIADVLWHQNGITSPTRLDALHAIEQLANDQSVDAGVRIVAIQILSRQHDWIEHTRRHQDERLPPPNYRQLRQELRLRHS